MIWQYLSNMYCYRPSQSIRGQVICSKHKKNVSIGLIWMKQPMVSSPLNISTQLSQAKKKWNKLHICIYYRKVEVMLSENFRTCLFFNYLFIYKNNNPLFSHKKTVQKTHLNIVPNWICITLWISCGFSLLENYETPDLIVTSFF